MINHSERLIGCNIKIVKGFGWHKSKIGEVFPIVGEGGIWSSGYGFPTEISGDFEWNGITIEDGNGKILLDDTFLKIFQKEKIVVNCETQEESIEFCDWMHNKGLEWSNGDSYKNDTEFMAYGEYTCYTGRGSYTERMFYEKEDYTIIKFKNCILDTKEKDFIETEEFREFVEYWKNNNIYVEFDNIEDKKRFTIEFDNSCQTSPQTGFLFVHWASTEWCHTDTPISMDSVIKYKDLKNWKEILIKDKEETTMKEYKILIPISLKSILETKPCNSQNEVLDFTNELISKGKSLDYYIETWEEFQEYPTLMNYIDWFLGSNKYGRHFLEEVKEFKPFDLTFRIESKEDLMDMYCRMNTPVSSAQKGESDGYRYTGKSDTKMFDVVDREMYRINN